MTSGDMNTRTTATGTAPGLCFTIETDVAGDLAHDAQRADALVTVRAEPVEGGTTDVPLAEVLVMDCSLSMADAGKIGAARQAVCAAVDALPDNTYFGVVAGTHVARNVFPPLPERGLAVAGRETRQAAKHRITALWAEGGTAIGRWLAHTADLLESAPAQAVRHVSLYTDGRNEHETPEELERALAVCADRFVCDARGLGDDWSYTELLHITQALHGSARAVDAGSLTDDLTTLVRQAQRLVVPRVYLGLRLDSRFRLASMRQIRPVEADLTGRQQRAGDLLHIPLGAWGAAHRQYRLSLRFAAPTLPVGEELRAAHIELLAETSTGERARCADARAMVVRRHTNRDPLPARPEELTRVENAHELGLAMRGCANAHERGDLLEAHQELRHALALAQDLDDGARVRLLESVAIRDEHGVVLLRPDVTRGEMQRVGLESTYRAALPTGPAEPVDALPHPRPVSGGEDAESGTGVGAS
ncbi:MULTISPECIES: VWA domain-containing protein [Streptomyces]|uniref:VWA domain-containing protein n=1 Tax=Streptomyces TaxID=1883 RepID=UPI001F2FB663|nr:vWA domain-containing protein [Streptomyces sp. AMCC400023]UJV44440.1 hypothetical protein CVT30_35515 [Streptomyces sp. AMCC400023]